MLKANPESDKAHYMLSQALMHLGDFAQAERYARKATQLSPQTAMYHQGLAVILIQDQRVDAAVDACDAGLDALPGDPELIGKKGECLVMASQYEDASSLLEPRLDDEPLNPTVALSYARLAPRIKTESRAIEVMQSLIDTPATPAPIRTHARFRLAALLDRVGRYDEAFEQARLANEFGPRQHDASQMTRGVDGLISLWPDPKRIATSGMDTAKPLFIVSVPRSGSTLLERIIGCHPRVSTGGEHHGIPHASAALVRRLKPPGGVLDPARFNPSMLRSEAKAYLAKIRGAKGDAYVTDKMLTNFQHLGLISRLFPNARIIECVRHPFDTAVSCYFQDFTTGNAYTRNLSDLGMFIKDYGRVMAHWKRVLPNPMLTVRYEDLVGDQEAETRRVLDFLELPFDDACLRFHESTKVAVTASNQQVTQPMYASSVRRCDNYMSHLGPLRDILGEPDDQ